MAKEALCTIIKQESQKYKSIIILKTRRIFPFCSSSTSHWDWCSIVVIW